MLIILIVTAVAAVRYGRSPRLVWSGIMMGVGVQVDNLNAWYGKSQVLHESI